MKKYVVQNNVRENRFFHGELSQKALAELVGVSRQTIVAIEKGKYSPTLELAFRIAMAFDKKVDEVFFMEEV